MNTVRPDALHSLSNLYEADETAWLEEMSRLVAERRFTELDIEHLSEYLADMAKRDKREVLNRLTVLLAHLLKWEYQPEQRTNSWRATIVVQRHELEGLLDSGTLRKYAVEIMSRAYRKAVERAAIETSLAEQVFPVDCPQTLDEVLGEDTAA